MTHEDTGRKSYPALTSDQDPHTGRKSYSVLASDQNSLSSLRKLPSAGSEPSIPVQPVQKEGSKPVTMGGSQASSGLLWTWLSLSTVDTDLYCGRGCLLRTWMSTIQVDLYCGRGSLLWTRISTIDMDLYCGHVLSPFCHSQLWTPRNSLTPSVPDLSREHKASSHKTAQGMSMLSLESSREWLEDIGGKFFLMSR